MEEIDVAITPYAITPINSMTKPFINQFKSFNEYTESQKSHSNSLNHNTSLRHNKSVKTTSGASKFQKSFNAGNQLHDISEDGPSESDPQSDIQRLESLFQKILSREQEDSTTSQNKLPDGYLIALSLLKKAQS
jgi:phosphoenolpyruvate carboxylase